MITLKCQFFLRLPFPKENDKIIFYGGEENERRAKGKATKEVTNTDPLLLMIISGILATIFFSTVGIELPIVWVLYIPYVFWILHLLKLAKPIYG